ncbi:hypothetical protein CHUV2995_02884 [Corynebacterium diphtheriae subsp. lausannense]|uniref:hypothetical protein n=1 Tax=Corynebacterium belfantii TaxID=2014537 RepID=UPI00095951BF|nr:hypothetical protein [Corynebacterium belfantii]MBG9311402.1 hypothetical protein [Corynebacterium belfantii]OLN14551.1 hypothetical protein BUE64_12480 [Corynebacterium diphtheriae subsp. lausannense]QBZ29476.1 hypothetical protein E4653_05820 [Corynebacterium diphtheriae subsp. lausannense]SPJ42050.1 hypothetical protein CHUV2995_02884 [Corynebacterium diphtheriae subsp. lausannense]
MRLDETLIFAMLQRREDPYIVSYRWDCASPYHAMRLRRRVAQYAREYPEFLTVVNLTSAFGSKDTDKPFDVLVKEYHEALDPLPLTVNVVIVETLNGVSIVLFLHHLLFDGTAMWNFVYELFNEGVISDFDILNFSALERSTLIGVKRKMVGVAPAALSTEMTFANLTLDRSLMDSVFNEIMDLELFSRLVSPVRNEIATDRMWGSEVSYKTVYESTGKSQTGFSSPTASITFDVFAQGRFITGLIPRGVCSFSLRTECDALVEQIGNNLRVSVASKCERHRNLMFEAIKRGLGVFDG